MKIKGFNKDLQCRGTQFEIGKEYKIELNGRELELCSDTCFHYCDSLRQVHDFYSVLENNRFCEIEVLGEEISDGEKCGSNHIRVVREIVGEELNILKGLVNENSGIFNSGYCNSGYYNSGNYNSGDYNSGYYNGGYRNSGDYNQEPQQWNYNDGYNSGYYNSGDYNSGTITVETAIVETATVDATLEMATVETNTGLFNSCNYSSEYSAPSTLKSIFLICRLI